MPDDWPNYWRDVCAPKLRAQKEKLGGRKLPEQDIAEFVEHRSGKRTGRALLHYFLHGTREPYLSQFLALCERLEIAPDEVLKPERHARPQLRRVAQPSADYRISQKRRTQKNQ